MPILALGSALALGCIIETMVRGLGQTYPIGEIVFFRMVLSLPVLLGGVLVLGRQWLASGNPRAQILRGAISLGAIACWFASLTLVPLADATALSFSTSLMVTALAAPMLGEAVTRRQWIAVLAGFCGTLVVSGPGTGWPWTGFALIMAANLLRALSILQSRRLALADGTGATVFYFTLVGALGTAPSLALDFVMPQPQAWPVFAAIGLLGGISQLLAIWALKVREATFSATMDYLRLPLAALAGFVVFAEVPSITTLAGAGIILVSAWMVRR